ncbi:hypothetical protein Ahy_B04g072312 [Arachis hypogaea]|uniref:Retrotransposon gag domain-containing protein n=1 Tax=Arachis hypogaea TaxID=3818 RepID=A0A444ZMW1_ARAHY|nr:hypothetical protein Ahy_B04g072312 [Arachis hypogaea]
MKKIMRNQFVPSSYHMRNRLQQGSQSVMEYHKEFLYLIDKANIKRSPKVIMERFLFGLHEELANKAQCYHYATMEDLIKLAVDMEQMQQFIVIWGSKGAKFKDQTKIKVSNFKKNIIDRQKKRISSTPIFNSSSKLKMEEFVEYSIDGDVSLEDSKVQNFSTGSLGCNFVDALVNYGGINMDEGAERQLIAHFGQDGKSMARKIELAHMKDIATIQSIEKSHQTMVFEPRDWVWIPWREEKLLIQDSRTNLFEEGEDDT